MELLLMIMLIIAGFVLIVFGGDMFVDSAIWMAEKAKVPKLLIGATIVSFGTTLPEITVSILAAASGDVGLAVSNATGSMLANLTLILGIGLAAMTMKAARRTYAEKFIFCIMNIAFLMLFMIDLNFSLWESLLLLALFAAFMMGNVIQALKANRVSRRPLLQPSAAMPVFSMVPAPAGASGAGGAVKSVTEEGKDTPPVPDVREKPAWLMILFFILGAAGIGLGAKLLVDNVSLLAVNYLHIPTVIVGATIVAFGTSLPELVTAVNSIKKKSIEMSVGNVLGANIINGTFLVGISGAIQGTAGMPVIGDTGSLAVFVSVFAIFAGLLVLIIPILIKSRTFKWQGYAMIAIYVSYLLYLVLSTVL